MHITDEIKRAFWERAALTALPSLLVSLECTTKESVDMAVTCADVLLTEYVDRFEILDETTMTYARQEAAIDFKGNAEEEAARADHIALTAEEAP